MKSITPLFVRLLVLSQQIIRGCLVLRQMTGMPISVLKCNLQRQGFCVKHYILCFFFFFPPHMPHNSCDTASSWTEIPDASHTDSDRFCHKMIKSSLRRDLVEGHYLKFCLTNSVGTWCKMKFSMPPPLLPWASRGSKEWHCCTKFPN